MSSAIGIGGENDLVEAVKWLILSYNQPDEDDGKRHKVIQVDYEFAKSALPPEKFDEARQLAELHLAENAPSAENQIA